MPAPATTYERIVYKNPSEYHYMKVCLEFQDHGVGLNAAQFKHLLISALKDLFGEVDAALPLDILTYEEKTLSAILRICSSGLVKLWSSLTLLGSYKGKKCAFRVIQVKAMPSWAVLVAQWVGLQPHIPRVAGLNLSLVKL
ncbi:ribonuclease P protein subunit p14 isoform X1 [Otolemur garnettii]|uniref:ribonuclease P protein subunit p14 isoform X1 n=1 Tax=Otolemur garnettii TaxID=30611 RepID=UPI000C7F16D7|nr:ribonuclease P protein subunit p14 isoform X1 [Otolemur garnettii]XP_023366478.1 ribonuclease P protein subunit p14 isoform X1 [Otolemur garnettii]